VIRVRPLRILCLVAVAALASAAFAQQSLFIGDWKQNNDKSHLTDDIIQFSPAADGAIKFTAETRSYTFKTDGKEYTGSTGAQNVWKKIDDNNYERSATRNGIPIGTTTYKISSDGKTLVTEDIGTNPSGKSFDDTTKYARVSGTTGLMGSWKDTEVKMKEDFVMSWKPGASANSLRWELPDIKAYVDISLDGKDCTPVGPTVPKGLTLSLTTTGPSLAISQTASTLTLLKTGSRRMTMLEKINGKVISKSVFKVSADGKTLTEIQTPPDGKAPSTIIYDRQA
jgi:hypothetical protein